MPRLTPAELDRAIVRPSYAQAAREAERFEAMAEVCAIPAQAAECRRRARLARERARAVAPLPSDWTDGD